MSHFSVAVFSHSPSDVDSLLAPYYESSDEGSPYVEFVPSEYGETDENTGLCGYWTNPNARWDWYSIGGRWRGHLKLREGKTGTYGELSPYDKVVVLDPAYCDQALAADCDYSPNQSAYQKALRFWEIVVEGAPVRDDDPDDHVFAYKAEYYVERYGSKENYARQQAAFSTYACVLPNGEWHETGRMGWWGIDDATLDSHAKYEMVFNEALKQAINMGLFITIVDCHI